MNSTLPSFFNDARLTLVDVGARGGLSWQWAPFKHLITTVLVEPDPAEAAALVEKLKGEGLGGVKVIPKGLGARNGTAELNLLRNPECSSILEPNLPWLARFPESERFTTAKRIPIELSALDSELAALGVTKCDFLKLDVQGYELEVLAGASAAVRQCLVLEAETSFSEIYKGQPLFAQIDSALRPLGFPPSTSSASGGAGPKCRPPFPPEARSSGRMRFISATRGTQAILPAISWPKSRSSSAPTVFSTSSTSCSGLVLRRVSSAPKN